MATATPRLLQLAPELLQHILVYLGTGDLVSFGRTCTLAWDFVSPSNQSLWKSCFLQSFDNLASSSPLAPPRLIPDWHSETRRRYRALAAVACAGERPSHGQAYEEHVATLLDMIATSERRSITSSPGTSRNLSQIQSAFQHSLHSEHFIHDYVPDKDLPVLDLLSDEMMPSRPFTRSQVLHSPPSANASKLHVLYGLTARERSSRTAQGTARSIVYNWSYIGRDTEFGPFMPDGSGDINWRHLEAIYSIIMRSFEQIVHNRIRVPHGLHHNVPLAFDPTTTPDWAGVEQVWFGSYSYMDYSALFYFNMARPSPMNLNEIAEAHGGMGRARLKLDDSVKDDPRLATSLPLSDKLPKLYFSGTSVSEQYITMPIQMRGFAAMMKGETHVRWRFIISYDEDDQWSLQGVQPGGPQTGAVFGIWTQMDHDEDHGPIGPFIYIQENLCETIS